MCLFGNNIVVDDFFFLQGILDANARNENVNIGLITIVNF